MNNLTALITGASSGIGRATAETLGRQGVKLILLARRREKLEGLAHSLSDHTHCHCIAADVRDAETLETALRALPEDFAQVDILVNNAGLALGLEPAHETCWRDWQTMIDTNCTALAFITHQLLPGMVARNQGHIINIGSTAGHYPYPGGNIYGATKAFVHQFSANLRTDLLGTGVRVTTIAPGLTSNSEFSLVRFDGDREQAEQVYAGTQPLLAEDIANSIAWVAAQPSHVNINHVEIMPTCQAPAGLAVHRQT